MIDISNSRFVTKKEKSVEPKAPKVPFHCIDSMEVDFIRNKIKQNKLYLEKCTSQAAYKKVEKDTLFLENNILPILLAKTSLFHNEATKLFVKTLDAAIQSECNSMLMYLPINENYTDRPKAGVSNCKDKLSKTPLNVEIRADFYLYNRDGNDAPFEFVELEI